MRAMILAAGLGTRLKPYTDSTPKALIEIKGFPLLKLQIRKLSSEGFDQIIINVHHLSDQVKEFIKQNIFFNCSVTISDESEKLLNTGGALKKAAHFFSDRKPFLVYNVDILSDINLKSLMNHHLSSRSIATLAVQERVSSRKFLFNYENNLCGWMNDEKGKKIIVRDEETRLIPYSFSGIQIIDPVIFRYFPDEDVFSLVDLYLAAAKEQKINGFVHDEDNWIDIGKAETLAEAENLFEKIRNTYRV